MEPFHPSAEFGCLAFMTCHHRFNSFFQCLIRFSCVLSATEKLVCRELSRLKRLRRKCTGASIRYERLRLSKTCFEALGPLWSYQATICRSGAYHSSWKSLGIECDSFWPLNHVSQRWLAGSWAYNCLRMRCPYGRVICHCVQSDGGG